MIYEIKKWVLIIISMMVEREETVGEIFGMVIFFIICVNFLRMSFRKFFLVFKILIKYEL
jgi:hypothetical protein